MIATTNVNQSNIERLTNGDYEALAELFDQHRAALWRMIHARLDRRLSRRIDADDIVQQVFVDAANRISSFNNMGPNSFYVWLKLIATQTLADAFRRHLAQKRDALRDVSIESIPSLANYGSIERNSPMNTAILAERSDCLTKAINKLRAVDREIILLRGSEQLQNKEVAERLGIGEKAASIRYARALTKLKRIVAESSSALV